MACFTTDLLEQSPQKLEQLARLGRDAGFKKPSKVLPDLESQDVQAVINHTYYEWTPTDRAKVHVVDA